ncbi:aldo/keto reductase [Streptomyces sp. N2-109]|uniref:Aldo/keto reductase n=1 Tax=Streptomyces gossypii TaxID=2883101 RepID=A0ABT2JPL6_9ACTN|nr:aldo/keto reductase [Streptomyces gossypii]MCT2589806.1 aldo/keto reductase [Streptomyces gossypii]
MRGAHPRVVLGLHRSRYERRPLTAALDLGVRAIDTAFNYHGFTAHQRLAKVAGDLLPRLTLSTKVGYFPGPDGAPQHSLAPSRLLAALEQTNQALGRPPNLVFLHNPEVSLHAPADAAREALSQACEALADASRRGWCESWGIASWDPTPLPDLIDDTTPAPCVLMVRSGLLAGIGTLDAADELTARWRPSAVWGMSPFGGNAEDPVWKTVDPRMFLQEPTAEVSRIQAAFRVAYDLPSVRTVAVGTDNPAHLQEVLQALDRDTDTAMLLKYRKLLRERHAAINGSEARP